MHRLLLLRLLLLSVFVWSTSQIVYAVDYTFKEYVAQFGKVYTLPEDYELHRQAFQINYRKLLILEAVSQGSYSVQVNNFTDFTEQDRKNFLNYKPLQLTRPTTPMRLGASNSPLPLQLDYLQQGLVTPAKNQGSTCGACWAFSVAGQIESIFLKSEGKSYDLSEQYILSCTAGSDCSGGWPIDALSFSISNGLAIEQQYPYKEDKGAYDSNRICFERKLISPPSIVADIQHFQEISITQLKRLLVDNGPVSVGFFGSADGFLGYAGGVFTNCPKVVQPGNIDHVVLLIGWAENGDWIFKNSWGPRWGMNGFGRVPADKNCGINLFVDVAVLRQQGTVKTSPKQPVVSPISIDSSSQLRARYERLNNQQTTLITSIEGQSLTALSVHNQVIESKAYESYALLTKQAEAIVQHSANPKIQQYSTELEGQRRNFIDFIERERADFQAKKSQFEYQLGKQKQLLTVKSMEIDGLLLSGTLREEQFAFYDMQRQRLGQLLIDGEKTLKDQIVRIDAYLEKQYTILLVRESKINEAILEQTRQPTIKPNNNSQSNINQPQTTINIISVSSQPLLLPSTFTAKQLKDTTLNDWFEKKDPFVAGIMSRWGKITASGVYVPNVKRYYLIGGGGSSYFGNEVYAIDFNLGKLLPITQRTHPTLTQYYEPGQKNGYEIFDYPDQCDGVWRLKNGTVAPAARNLYGALAYDKVGDRLFVQAGRTSCQSNFQSPDIWFFNIKNSTWSLVSPAEYPLIGANMRRITVDPQTNQAIISHNNGAFLYDFSTTKYTKVPILFPYMGPGNYALDAKRRVLMGAGEGGFYFLHLDWFYSGQQFKRGYFSSKNKESSTWKLSGETYGIEDSNFPPLTYHAKIDRFVSWDGAQRLILFEVLWDKKQVIATTAKVSGLPAPDDGISFHFIFDYIEDLEGILVLVDDRKNFYLVSSDR